MHGTSRGPEARRSDSPGVPAHTGLARASWAQPIVGPIPLWAVLTRCSKLPLPRRFWANIGMRLSKRPRLQRWRHLEGGSFQDAVHRNRLRQQRHPVSEPVACHQPNAFQNLSSAKAPCQSFSFHRNAPGTISHRDPGSGYLWIIRISLILKNRARCAMTALSGEKASGMTVRRNTWPWRGLRTRGSIPSRCQFVAT